MVVCVAYKCSNRSSNKTAKQKKLEETKRITFHLFPKNLESRRLWMKAVRRESWEPSEKSRLCSDHFEEKWFNRLPNSVHLPEGAIPTIFSGFPSYLQQVQKQERRPRKRPHVELKHDTSSISNELPADPQVMSNNQKAKLTSENEGQQSTNTLWSLSLSIKEETDDDYEETKQDVPEYNNLNYTCVGNVKTEDVKGVTFMKDPSHKVGHDSENNEILVKLEGQLDQVGCYESYDGYKNDIVATADASIKQEIGDIQVMKIEIEEHNKVAKVEDNSEQELESEEQPKDAHVREEIQCQFCGYKPKVKRYLQQHIKRKHSDNVVWHRCHVCDYKTKTMYYLRRHIKAQHSNKIEWHQCQLCDFRTKTKNYIIQHLRKIHVERKIYVKTVDLYHCDSCKYKTNNMKYLKEHVKRKHVKNVNLYQCRFCDLKTKYKSVLEKHFTLKHDEEAEYYQCQSCQFRTKLKQLLLRHVKKFHN